MRKIAFVLVLTLLGCETVTGPISGKKYSLVDGMVFNAPSYSQELKESYLKTASNIKPEIIAAIKSSSLIIGMTKEQVLASIGPPDKKNITATKNILFEQWIYYRYHQVYVYLQNGFLSAIQN